MSHAHTSFAAPIAAGDQCFTRKIDTEVKANCEHCGSARTSRMMSKFGRSYTRADIIDRYGDASNSNNPDAYRDPRQIGSWVEKRFEGNTGWTSRTAAPAK
ncbi:MAG: hypothetical protein U0837_02255 [Dehalococcoidia bacterium]